MRNNKEQNLFLILHINSIKIIQLVVSRQNDLNEEEGKNETRVLNRKIKYEY